MRRLPWVRVLGVALIVEMLGGTVQAWTNPIGSQRTSNSCQQSSSTTALFGLRGKKVRKERRKALKEATPPRIETPYGAIRLIKPPRVCDTCRGRGQIRCGVCEGRGIVRASGQSKYNKIDRLVGSQWTSVEVYNGHRHHTVMEVTGSVRHKDNMAVRMQNCCGPQQDFWISVQELRDKMVWRRGWLTLQDIERAQGGALRDARLCFRCKGGRILPCIECDGVGEIPSYEPLYD